LPVVSEHVLAQQNPQQDRRKTNPTSLRHTVQEGHEAMVVEVLPEGDDILTKLTSGTLGVREVGSFPGQKNVPQRSLGVEPW
jgi:hypothetical protein